MTEEKIQGNIADRLKGTKTEQNLHVALSGESQAYLRYKWFEKKAESDGYIEIAHLFADVAENEKAHAEIWFRYLGGYSSTERNLETAAGGEHFEWETMYAEFASIAREEGFADIAGLFDRVASIEKQHEKLYSEKKSKVERGEVFEKAQATRWICINCGYVAEGKEPPKVCPTCSYTQGYFKEYGKN